MVESMVMERYLVWIRKIPRLVLLVFSGSPSPASPLDTRVV